MTAASSVGAMAPTRSFETAELPEGGAVWPMADHPHAVIIEDVFVNGEGPFRFMLDTGTTGGVRLDTPIADRLGIERAGTTRSGARRRGAGSTYATVEVETLEVGGAVWTNVYGVVRDLNAPGTPEGARLDGFLAWHLFAEWTLTIDYPGREVRVNDEPLPRPGRDGVSLMRGDRDGPTVPLAVGAWRVNALIDTGSPAGVLIASRFQRRLPIEGGPREAGTVSTIDGTSAAHLARLTEPVTAAGVNLGADTVVLTDAIFPANLGSGALRRFVVAIDAHRHRIRFTPGTNGTGQPGVSPGSAPETPDSEPQSGGVDSETPIHDDG